MFNYKNVVLTLFSISLIFSDQFENYFNGAIPSYTKTPKKGKMNIGLSFGSGVFSQNFNQDGELSDLASSTSFSSLGLGFRYHGFNGAGVELVVIDHSEAGGANMLSVYFVWNEMYSDKNPAIIPWQHSYTFPLSRNISKISVLNFEGESYPYLNHSIDLILSSKFILSTAINITSDTEIASNLLSSHFIYDIDDYFNCFNLNVRAPFVLSKELVPDMIEKNWGRIINLGSSSSYMGFKYGSYYRSEERVGKECRSRWSPYH